MLLIKTGMKNIHDFVFLSSIEQVLFKTMGIILSSIIHSRVLFLNMPTDLKNIEKSAWCL